MKDHRLEILVQARKRLGEGTLSPADQNNLLQLIDILMLSVSRYSNPASVTNDMRSVAENILEKQALLEMLRQQANELDALKKLSINLTSSLDLPTVLEAVVTEAMNLLQDARAVHIFLYDEDYDILEFGAALNNKGERDKSLSEPRPNGLTHTVARTGERIVVPDIKDHPLYEGVPVDWDGSVIGIPLTMKDKVVGVMNLSRSRTGHFSPSDLRLIGLLANQASVAIVNASIHEKVSKQAYSDTVTGLPNRRALDEHLENEWRNARKEGKPFAVVMMDLDGFKVINDTYGHAEGDKVLRITFSFISQGLRSSDFLARYGGDEVTLILNQTDTSSALLVTQKLREKLENFRITMVDGRELVLTMTGGIAVYPIHASTTTGLIRAADEALYRAKKYNRGEFMLARNMTGPLNPSSLAGLG
ncbi:MAG: GGDEF domain-containing protein [Anaerolineales bacterium]|nr:GGDEF domain-containing protein [Anaerolineales bacterium]